jgi:glycosyltransferase involved in cell wall biosynthesis
MNNTKPLKVLIVHPQFTNLGGAELVSLRFIERSIMHLQAHVTILCAQNINIEDIQIKAGILFSTNNLKMLVADQPFWLKWLQPSLHQLRLAYLHRAAKVIASNYDLCIGTYNEIDFGRKGVQYIHHPSFADSNFLESFKMTGGSKLKNVYYVEKAYQMLVRKVSKDTVEGFRNNVTLTNSNFIAEKLKQLYGLESTVVYPSVTVERSDQIDVPWDRRKLRFITIARISSDKNLLEFIDICRVIAKKMPEAEFMIIGRIGRSAYYKYLNKYIKQAQVPVQIRTDIDKTELKTFLQESKFYIATKRYEHYGIATLEAAGSGCLTFVHDTGGQIEIISSALLRYQTDDDLLNKIQCLLTDSAIRNKILEEMKINIRLFTLQRFNIEIDTAIDAFLSSQSKYQNV